MGVLHKRRSATGSPGAASKPASAWIGIAEVDRTPTWFGCFRQLTIRYERRTECLNRRSDHVSLPQIKSPPGNPGRFGPPLLPG
jgi:hypothetical protein